VPIAAAATNASVELKKRRDGGRDVGLEVN